MQLTYLGLFLLVAKCLAVTHPWIGAPRKDAFGLLRHLALMNQTVTHKADIKTIFFGDSITQGWEGLGLDIWNQHYTERHAYNYGDGGDLIENLIWRIQQNEIFGVMAKVVVLKIGTNNMIANTPMDIAHGIKEVINQILFRMPNTRILLLGILPRDGLIEAKVSVVNALISTYNDNTHVFYLDMSPHFQDSPGKEKPGLYLDTIHLTKQGYQVWYEAMEPLFKKLYDM